MGKSLDKLITSNCTDFGTTCEEFFSCTTRSIVPLFVVGSLVEDIGPRLLEVVTAPEISPSFRFFLQGVGNPCHDRMFDSLLFFDFFDIWLHISAFIANNVKIPPEE